MVIAQTEVRRRSCSDEDVHAQAAAAAEILGHQDDLQAWPTLTTTMA
jgi:hypothetical protein